jgi:hypothetical protein
MAWNDYLGAEARYHEEAARMGPCDFDFSAPRRRFEESLSNLNPLDRFQGNSPARMAHPWVRVRWHLLNQEATLRVLELKEALRQSRMRPQGQFALDAFVRIRGLETGGVCGEDLWSYLVEGDRPAYVLRFEGPEMPKGIGGVRPPMEHRIPIDPGR